MYESLERANCFREPKTMAEREMCKLGYSIYETKDSLAFISKEDMVICFEKAKGYGVHVFKVEDFENHKINYAFGLDNIELTIAYHIMKEHIA